MTLVDSVKQDVASAMRAGEKDRVGALRLVLSELQKAHMEGTRADGKRVSALVREALSH